MNTVRSCLVLFAASCATSVTFAQKLGPFEDHVDVGTVLTAGTAEFDRSLKRFTVTGSGENMWAREDDFHFVWKKMSGDVAIEASIAFPTPGGNAHRKGVLMIRQTLDADSPYVDAALHGDGLTSLQSREEKGGATHEVGTAAASPTRLRLEKRGEYFVMFLAKDGEPLRLAGGSMRLALTAPFYIGIGVCAHDKNVVERAVFSNVEIGSLKPLTSKRTLYSTLETVSVTSTDRRVTYVAAARLASPTWSEDGKNLSFTEDGKARRIAVEGGHPEEASLEGGVAKPEAAPDGTLYYVSENHVWRKNGDGSNPEQLTKDSLTDFDAHVSPDGKRLIFLSADVRPAEDGDVLLRMFNIADGKVTVIAKLIGGKGTMNATSWSPDSKRVAFVSYQYLPQSGNEK